ncbi:hypothetical protein AAC387_Pa01g2129 [Persea americana]
MAAKDAASCPDSRPSQRPAFPLLASHPAAQACLPIQVCRGCFSSKCQQVNDPHPSAECSHIHQLSASCSCQQMSLLEAQRLASLQPSGQHLPLWTLLPLAEP